MVVGAGNVVARRLLPALDWLGFPSSQLCVAGTTEDPANLRMGDNFVTVARFSPGDLPDAVARHDGPVWLATPPFAARQDLLAAAEGRPCVCEKPLGMTYQDLAWLDGPGASALEQVYCLSYYEQEKFAPALWLLGLADPSSRLDRAGAIEGRPLARAPELLGAILDLSEPLTRSLGDPVTPWCLAAEGPAGRVLELAVHAPAVVYALGLGEMCLEVGSDVSTALLSGPRSRARVRRPGPLARNMEVHTSSGTLTADAQARSAVLGRARVAIRASVPAYAAVAAGALDWLDGVGPRAAEHSQLAALRALLPPYPCASGPSTVSVSERPGGCS